MDADASASAALSAIGPLGPARRSPFLAGFCALPGAGKSHLAGLLAEVTGAVRLSSDAMRRQLGMSPLDPAVFPIQHQLATTLLAAGHPVLLDSNAARAAEREQVRELGCAAGVPVLIAYIDTPPEVRAARLAARRGRPLAPHEVLVPDEALLAMADRLEPPGRAEQVLVVSGCDGQTALAAILAALPAR